MILVVTNRGDLTADWLILELRARKTPYFRLNTEDFPSETKLTWLLAEAQRFTLTTQKGVVDLASTSAVWYRRPAPSALRPDLSDDEGAWARGETDAALRGALAGLDCLWVNRPSANRRASDKLEQLTRARSLGLTTPATLVTSDPDEAQDFIAQSDGTVCKPIWNGRPTVRGEERIFFTTVVEDAVGLGPEPYLLQEMIPKLSDVRLTLIGSKAFAAEIDSQQSEDGRTDWRRAVPLPVHTATSVPDEIVEKCLKLVESYDLKFGAIDLARTPDGSLVFFELNPNGQWAWIEHATGLPLRAHLANLLEEGA